MRLARCASGIDSTIAVELINACAVSAKGVFFDHSSLTHEQWYAGRESFRQDRRKGHLGLGAWGKAAARVFGEMVGVLTERGEAPGAIALEQLWNQLARRIQFRLFCAYSNRALRNTAAERIIEDICSTHSQVIGPRAPQQLEGQAKA